MILEIVIAIVAILAGAGAGYAIRETRAKSKTASAETKAEQLVANAKTKEKELELAAKEKATNIIEEAKTEAREREAKLARTEDRLVKKEESIDAKVKAVEEKEAAVTNKGEEIKKVRKQLDDIREEQLKRLEQVADLPKAKAEEMILARTEEDMKEKLMSRMRKLENTEHEQFEQEARKILSTVIERVAVDHSSDMVTTTVEIPNDDMKGRIIGKEGRNIRALENACGVEIIIDDTPGAIVISGFSPIRRHLAKMVIEDLMVDGRIHPTKIEEAVKRAKKTISENVTKAGDAVLYELGLTGFDRKLVQIIGRMKYRTSYGQNALRHSLEVAHLAGLLAAELGADVSVAKKAGLLHDIGKSVNHELGGDHHTLSIEIAKKFGMPDAVVDAIEAGHDHEGESSVEAIIVRVADAISAARPGARRQSIEEYTARLKDIEDIATGFEGVEKSFAIQAGREVRVIVKPEHIDDYGAQKLAKNIAKKIESEMQYPGEIKVNVIRETRAVEYAR